MKRTIILVLALICLLAAPGQARAEQSLPAMFEVGSKIWTDEVGNNYAMDVAPFIENGRVYVPVRYLAYALGLHNEGISWDADNNELMLQNDNWVKRYADGQIKANSKKIILSPGSNMLFAYDNAGELNNSPTIMDSSPVIRQGRVFLPARWVAEAFGASVDWDPQYKIVGISKNAQGQGNAVLPMPENYEDKTPAPPYKWNYKKWAFEWDSLFTVGDVNRLLNEYRSAPHPHNTDNDYFEAYCVKLDPWQDEMLSAMVYNFKVDGDKKKLTQYEVICDIIAFLQQNIKYVTDQESTGIYEYPRYPLETLLARKGDCEDTAILTAKLIRAMGYGTALIVYEKHCGVGVKCDSSMPGWSFDVNGDKYYYLETTSEGWKIGEMPPEFQLKKANIFLLPQKEYKPR